MCVGTCQNRLHLPESSKHCQSVFHLSIDKAKGKRNILCACDPRGPPFIRYSSFRAVLILYWPELLVELPGNQ